MTKRKGMPKFGKVLTTDAVTEASHVQRCEEDIRIEINKKVQNSVQTESAEDKFLEEALRNCENLFKEKKVWKDMNRERQAEREAAEEKKEAPAATGDAAGPVGAAPAASRYVPPSLRMQQAGKAGGKGDLGQQQEASLRITNLSEDVREGDLQDLFGQFGRLQRVYLAKDMNTHLSKGFAFVTYYDRGDAQKAIDKLNGHGYDNLILQVQWAKPRA